MEFRPKICHLFILIIIFTFKLCAEENPEPLTIVSMENNPPFSFALPDGTKTGLYIEFWELWSKTTGTPINVVLTSLEELIKAAKNKNVIIAGLFINENRKQWADFSVPIDRIETSILFNRSYSNPIKLEQMNGLKVAVLAASYQAEYLKTSYPLIELFLYSEPESIIDLLLNKEVDAVVAELPTLDALVAKRGLSGVFKFADKALLTNNVHGAIARGQPELLEEINSGIENIPINALISLEKKWLPSLEPFFNEAVSFTALTTAEKKWLQDHPSFTIGIDPDLPPFEFVDGKGIFAGLTADYISYANKLLSIKMIPKYGLTWLEAFDAFKKGEIDIMSAAIVTDERLEIMNFTDPYIDMPTAIVTRNNSFYFENMSSLNNKVLGIVGGDFIKIIELDYPNIKINIIESEVEGFKLLQAGKIDAVIAPIAVANFEIDKRKMHDLIIASFAPYNLKLSVAIRKGLEPLVSILNKTFADMTDKQKSTINNTWLRSYIKTGIDRQDLLSWGLPIVFILLLLIISIITHTNKRLKLVIEKNKNLARRIVVIQEEERKILSRDLHDEIGQNLTALQLHINLAMQYQAPSKLASIITNIDEIVAITYQSAYELMHWLRPIVLDEYGLKFALSNRIFTKMLKESNINYRVSVEDDLALLDGELSISIYRIVQEAISNAAKHSKAANLWVTIRLNGPGLELEIRDDGIGFDIEEVVNSVNSFGLRGIQDRVDAMNGIYKLTSDSRGTSLFFKFKLQGC